MVAVGHPLIADDLKRLVALAEQEHGVTLARCFERDLDGLGPIELHDDALPFGRHVGADAGQHLVHDGPRIFRTRVVRGHDDAVREAERRLQHQRSLPAITIAAAAEHRAQAGPAELASQRFSRGAEDLLEGVWIVGVVDEDQLLPRMKDPLHPARHAPKAMQRLDPHVESDARREPDGQRRERVGAVELAHHRQPQLGRLSPSAEAKDAARQARLPRLVREIGAGPEAAVGLLRHPLWHAETRTEGRVDVDDREAVLLGAPREGFGEEPLLGLEVGVERAVIVEVIPRQVGEHGHVQRHAAHARLGEPLAGGFERDGPGTARDELREALLENQRRRGRVPGPTMLAEVMIHGANHPRGETTGGEDRFGQTGHRGLSVGPRDTGTEQRAPRIAEALCRQLVQRVAPVLRHEDRTREPPRDAGFVLHDQRACTAGDGVIEEVVSVSRDAGDRDEERTRDDLAGVVDDLGHLDIVNFIDGKRRPRDERPKLHPARSSRPSAFA